MSNVTLQWLGHSTFIATSPEGARILIDPWVHSNPACPAHCHNPAPIELILVTHGHGDHISDCPSIARSTGATVVGILELCHWLKAQGVSKLLEMNKGGTVDAGPVKVTMVHADHSGGVIDGNNVVHYAGEPVGFIVHFSNGLRLWHTGDTAIFGDMALIADIYKPDVVLLPIGGHYVMSPVEASKAVRLTGIKRIVPMHFGTFPVLSGTPDELARLTADIDGLQILAMKPGDTLTL